MRPFTWLENLWWLIQAPWVWSQCKALDGKDGDVCRSYCQRRKAHFGEHITFDGRPFTTGESL